MPKEAIKQAIDDLVTKNKPYIDKFYTKKGIKVFDYNNMQAEIEGIYQKTKGLLKEEIKLKDTHCVFYHGHSNPMAAYYDILGDFMGIISLRKFDKNHPLHYKTTYLNKVGDMNGFLNQGLYQKAHIDHVANLKKLATNDSIKYGKYKNIVAFDNKRNLGVGKAPDSAPLARDHLQCVNLSLFGNINNPCESSCLFAIMSGNFAKLDQSLTIRLFKEVGILSENATTQEIEAIILPFEKYFQARMAQSGGGIMQIFMKNDIVDRNSFMSWAKGIPYYMDKQTGKFATRNHNDRPVVWLDSPNQTSWMRPSVLNTCQRLKNDPRGLTKTFSYDGQENLNHLDRYKQDCS